MFSQVYSHLKLRVIVLELGFSSHVDVHYGCLRSLYHYHYHHESKLTLTTTQKNNGFIYQNEVTYSQESVDMCAGLLVLISGESGIKKKKIIKNENVFRNDSKSAFRQNMRRL